MGKKKNQMLFAKHASLAYSPYRLIRQYRNVPNNPPPSLSANFLQTFFRGWLIGGDGNLKFNWSYLIYFIPEAYK